MNSMNRMPGSQEGTPSPAYEQLPQPNLEVFAGDVNTYLGEKIDQLRSAEAAIEGEHAFIIPYQASVSAAKKQYWEQQHARYAQFYSDHVAIQKAAEAVEHEFSIAAQVNRLEQVKAAALNGSDVQPLWEMVQSELAEKGEHLQATIQRGREAHAAHKGEYADDDTYWAANASVQTGKAALVEIKANLPDSAHRAWLLEIAQTRVRDDRNLRDRHTQRGCLILDAQIAHAELGRLKRLLGTSDRLLRRQGS